jgi:hypothetical protein
MILGLRDREISQGHLNHGNAQFDDSQASPLSGRYGIARNRSGQSGQVPSTQIELSRIVEVESDMVKP